MHTIDRITWARRDHFEKFRTFHDPHFNMCAIVDLSAFLPAIRSEGVPFTAALVYLITRTANDIPEFRQRIRGDDVVEHDTVHPSTTVLAGEDLFSFCCVDYSEDLGEFADRFAAESRRVGEEPSLAELDDRDDLLYMTAIPWVSFTSFAHPIPPVPDSIPRFAWGKYAAGGGRVTMPLSVQGHHALMDGLHVGGYYRRIQGYLDRPAAYLPGW